MPRWRLQRPRQRQQRLTGALLDRLTHHVHILEMNGDSFRLKHSTTRRRKGSKAASADTPVNDTIDPATGEITPPQ